LREEFFSSSFGGIAERSGGITARLWREDTKKFKQRFQRIMAGPTLYSSLGGYIVDCGEDVIYYDDKLSDGMYAVISGQYAREDSKRPPRLLLLFLKKPMLNDRMGPIEKRTKYINPIISINPAHILSSEA
jgi:hypothetical protein